MINSARTPSLKSVPFLVEELHCARKPAPLHRFLVYCQLSDNKQRPHVKSQVCAILRRRVPPCAETSAARPFSRPRSSVPFFVEEFYRVRKPAPLDRFLVHDQSSDDKQHPHAKSQVCAVLSRRVTLCAETSAAAPFSVEELHCARKPAPLHRFLVYGQLSDNKQRPYAKSQVCAVLRRRVSLCAETSAATPFSLEEFHRLRKPAPLHRFLVHDQLSDDKQRPYAKSQACAVLSRRVTLCAETGAATPFPRLRSIER
ncbi:hypothetical protein EVAR_67810_1 [Eumeta japonica]|uniref:Uncharacterized protein n=1 Tax=Eumeta variegata TaxID=151549 RepID=A0A4C1ZX21_EUMVA|nr:hypothetical protein EVAR_67810_1 [Eumeta japonica]